MSKSNRGILGRNRLREYINKQGLNCKWCTYVKNAKKWKKCDGKWVNCERMVTCFIPKGFANIVQLLQHISTRQHGAYGRARIVIFIQ